MAIAQPLTAPQAASPALAAYRQALASYLWNRSFGLVLLWIVGVAVGWTEVGVFPKNWLTWGVAAAVPGALIALHVANRLSDYRAALVPHYRRAQLAVFVTLLAALSVALILWTQLRLRGVEAGSVGVIVLGVAAGCWAIRATWLVLLGSSIWILFFFSGNSAAWVVASTAVVQSPLFNLAATALGIGLAATFAGWLWHLNEVEVLLLPAWGRAGRHQLVCSEFDNRQRRLVSRQPGVLARLVAWLGLRQERRSDAALDRLPMTTLWTVRRWQVPWARGIWWQACAAVAVTVVPLLLGFGPAGVTDPVLRARQTLIAFMPLVIALGSGGGLSLPLRQPFFATEMLRPVTRRQYFRQLGLGLLGRWLLPIPPALAALWLIEPSRSLFSQLDARSAVELVALVAAMTFLLLASIVWAARFGSIWVQVIALTVAIVGYVPAGEIWVSRAGTLWPLVTAAVVGTLGLGLLWHSYRYWLTADLG